MDLNLDTAITAMSALMNNWSGAIGETTSYGRVLETVGQLTLVRLSRQLAIHNAGCSWFRTSQAVVTLA